MRHTQVATSRDTSPPYGGGLVKKLFVLLVVLVGVALVGDRLALSAASSNLDARARDRVRGAGTTHADISSFPFIGRLLVSGSITRVRFSVDRLAAGALTFASVRADLHGVVIDRSELVHERRVRLIGVKRGTLSAELTDAEVSRALGVTVRFQSGGAVSVASRGLQVEGRVQVSNGALAISGGRLSALTLPIPRASLMSCAARDVRVLDGRVRVSCTVDRLPTELARIAVLGG